MAKTNVIRIRFSDEEKTAIERQAQKNHANVSTQIRMELRGLFERDSAELTRSGK